MIADGHDAHQVRNITCSDELDTYGLLQMTKELEKIIIRILDERDRLAGDREQLRQIVEAARRERVMAIEERDKIVHR